HHRAVHEEGYQVSRAPDGALDFRRPDGRPLPEVPPSPSPVGDPVEMLHEQHVAAGLAIHARTSCARWLGERLDVGWAIEVLHPRMNPPAAAGGDPGQTLHAGGAASR